MVKELIMEDELMLAENSENLLSEEGINQEITQFKLVQNFIKNHMKEGEDFGKIPGSPKPSLFKAGAEKLCNLYGLSIRIDVLERVENWEEGFFHYLAKCTLVNRKNGEIAAEGVGSCNNREGKYSKQNPYNMVNTILKMAKKRALIDATLSATRISGIFTQDLEDIGEAVSSPEAGLQMATKNQRSFIAKLIKEINISENELIKLSESITGKSHSKDWSKDEASEVIKALQGYKSKGDIVEGNFEVH